MRCVIGIVGKKGSGKGTFTDLLKKRLPGVWVSVIGFSDILYETLRAWDIPTTREYLQKIVVVMEQLRHGALSHAVHKRILATDADIVVIDGVRWETDVELLRSFPVNILVCVERDAKKRFDNLKKRDAKVGEGEMAWEQFMREEQAPNEVKIPEIGAQADFRIDNNGTLDAFGRQVDSFIAKFRTALT